MEIADEHEEHFGAVMKYSRSMNSILTIKDADFYKMTEPSPKCISDGELQDLAKLVSSMIITALTGVEPQTMQDTGSITAIAMLSCLMMLKLTKSHRLERFFSLLTDINQVAKKEDSSRGSQELSSSPATIHQTNGGT